MPLSRVWRSQNVSGIVLAVEVLVDFGRKRGVEVLGDPPLTGVPADPGAPLREQVVRRPGLGLQ